MNKRLLIIIGSLLAIYLAYIFIIRKWLEKEGMSTKIAGFGGTEPIKPAASLIPSGLEGVSIQSVQGLERI